MGQTELELFGFKIFESGQNDAEITEKILPAASWKVLVLDELHLKICPCGLCLPEIYVASRQPLQSSYIQDRELVPCQTESLHAPQLL